jgi:hypothetical protein
LPEQPLPILDPINQTQSCVSTLQHKVGKRGHAKKQMKKGGATGLMPNWGNAAKKPGRTLAGQDVAGARQRLNPGFSKG